MSNIDFDALNKNLSLRIRELLTSWLPGGKIIGQEYMVASLLGGPGDSLRFNTIKLIGSDFATGEKFGDPIDLYAKINGLSQFEAAKQLLEQYPLPLPVSMKSTPAIIEEPKIILPPDGSMPDMKHYKYGEPVEKYCYKNKSGKQIYYIARYESEGAKYFFPWSYFNDGKWKMKGQNAPRPLFLLDQISSDITHPILIVEGEKSALSAKKTVGAVYDVTTWSNGAQSYSKADWSPVYGKSVLIWPDADEAGIHAAQEIAKILSAHCPEIKIIDVSRETQDAADAYDYGFTWEEFKEWAKPRISVYSHATAQPEIMPQSKKHSPDNSSNDDDDNGKVDGSLYAIWERIGLASSTNGQPICNQDNALRVLQGLPFFKSAIWYDEFYQKIFTNWNSSTPREWRNIDTTRLTTFIQRNIAIRKVSDDMVYKSVMQHAYDNLKNEPKDWMKSLEWDGEPRISQFFYRSAGSLNNDYIQAASKNFWITMVARIFRPGCQVDNMIVFEGPQGKGKTSLLRAIGGNWYCSAKEQVTSNNFFQILQGKLIVEIAELDSFNRAEITRIKQVVSDPIDTYRTPYDRLPEDHPRQSILVGTTNEHAYLRDDTGGRRFWPVKCGEINLDTVHQNREQLFAEAIFCLNAGQPWHIMPDSAQDEQEQRRQVDPWEDHIQNYIIQKFEVSTHEVMNNCLKIEPSKQTRFDEIRIGKTLLKIGWKRFRGMRNGQLKWLYALQGAYTVKPNEEL